MQVIPQLQIQNASCQPVPGSDGTVTLDCAGTLHNPGTQLLEVLVLGAVPGHESLYIKTYTLPAGASVNLPAPPTGGFWVIAYQSREAIRRAEAWREALSFAGSIGLYGLAGVGAGTLLGITVLAIRNHRRH